MLAQNLSEKELANLALEYKLFVPDWQMEKIYKHIQNGHKSFGIHLIMEETPLAACVIDFEMGCLNVFVKKEFRNQKYGQKVVHEAMIKYNQTAHDVYGAEGVVGSEKFYNSCGLAYFKYANFPMSGNEMSLFVKKKITFNDIKQKRIQEYFDLTIGFNNKPRKLSI